MELAHAGGHLLVDVLRDMLLGKVSPTEIGLILGVYVSDRLAVPRNVYSRLLHHMLLQSPLPTPSLISLLKLRRT